MMEQKKGRRNPIFDLSDPKQKNAFDFLGIIERDQAVCISILINKLMNDYNITDLSNVTKGEIKNILKKLEQNHSAVSNSEIDKDDIREMVLSILKENQKEIGDASEKEMKAHDEPLDTTEPKQPKQASEPENIENEEEEDWEDEAENSLNVELLAELASFNA